MYRSKKKRNIIIVSLIGVLLCMVVGYAAFNTELKISGTSKVTSNWDIEITNVTSGTIYMKKVMPWNMTLPLKIKEQ